MVNDKNVSKEKKKWKSYFTCWLTNRLVSRLNRCGHYQGDKGLLYKIPNACALTDQYSILSRFT